MHTRTHSLLFSIVAVGDLVRIRFLEGVSWTWSVSQSVPGRHWVTGLTLSTGLAVGPNRLLGTRISSMGDPRDTSDHYLHHGWRSLSPLGSYFPPAMILLSAGGGSQDHGVSLMDLLPSWLQTNDKETIRLQEAMRGASFLGGGAREPRKPR